MAIPVLVGAVVQQVGLAAVGAAAAAITAIAVEEVRNGVAEKKNKPAKAVAAERAASQASDVNK